MKSISILDCTLRDGGFVNDWHFGRGSIENIVSRLDKACIEFVEIGFLDGRRKYDENRTILPNTDSFNPLFENLELKNSKIVAMIDYGTCEIEAITPQAVSALDGIRVIFKKKDSTAALNFCRLIKEKGYKLFVQPVSVTSYSDEEMTGLLKEINKIGPFSVSIVDTYGLMHRKDLLRYFNLMDKNLNAGTAIGYHAHNNFQLAYANCIELASIDSNRELLIDGSLYGMGKGAGNANTELLAMYLNKNHGKIYNVDQLLEAIDVDILREFRKKYWGYSFMHYIAALNDCHPDYVKTLIEKKTLSVKSINDILAKIEKEKKLTFDIEMIEKKYLEYQNISICDHLAYEELKAALGKNNILVLAPGKSIETHREVLGNFIKDRKPIIITINFIHEGIKADYVFMGNAKRYSQFFNKIYKDDSSIKVICTSNISESSKKINYKLNFSGLMFEEEPIRDNPVLMLLKALIKADIKTVYIAGFDGYSEVDVKNYMGIYPQFLHYYDNIVLRNEATRKVIREMSEEINLEFLTPSFYI